VVLAIVTMLSEPLLHHIEALDHHRDGIWSPSLPHCYDVLAIPVAGLRAALEPAAGPLERLLAANHRMQRRIATFETGLDEGAVLGRWIRPPLQTLLGADLGAGNEQVYCGRNGWLFYRPAIDHLTGAGFLEPRQLARRALEGADWEHPPVPDPRPAILELNAALTARGITLVLMPIPVKASIHPEHMSSRYRRTAGDDPAVPLHNPSFAPLLAELATAGVDVFDPSAILGAGARAGEDQFLRTDTHWRPEAMQQVAEALAEHIQQRVELPEVWSPTTSTETVTVRHRGDLAAMLELPPGDRSDPGDGATGTAASEPAHDAADAESPNGSTETVTVTRVLTADDSRWQIDPGADVLVLGDSFANIYSQASMGFGESSGLVEHLGRALGRPIDAIVRNDAGASATRELLGRELAQGRDRLAGKRVVVWELTARELSVGDWRPVPMQLGTPRPSRFVVPPEGQTWAVTGTIAAMGPVPRPRSAPYPDYIVALHLVDLVSDEPAANSGEALVFMLAMKGSTWREPAQYRIGQTLHLRLQSWADKEPELGLINRGEIYDDDLIFQEPCWAEEVP